MILRTQHSLLLLAVAGLSGFELGRVFPVPFSCLSVTLLSIVFLVLSSVLFYSIEISIPPSKRPSSATLLTQALLKYSTSLAIVNIVRRKPVSVLAKQKTLHADITSSGVLLRGNSLQMIRITARGILTKVVNLIAVRYRALKKLIRHPVGCLGWKSIRTIHSVILPSSIPIPFPASSRNLGYRPLYKLLRGNFWDWASSSFWLHADKYTCLYRQTTS